MFKINQVGGGIYCTIHLLIKRRNIRSHYFSSLKKIISFQQSSLFTLNLGEIVC